MNINENKINKSDLVEDVDNLIKDIDCDYLENKTYWFNFYNKYVPNLPFGVRQTIQRVPFRNILSRNRNNPRAQVVTQRLFSLQERANTQVQTITLNTIENNSSASREKLDDFVRQWGNERDNIIKAINELKNLIKKVGRNILKKLNEICDLLNNLTNLINEKGNAIINSIDEKGNAIIDSINESVNKINGSLDKIDNSLKQLNQTITKSIEDAVKDIKSHLDDKFNDIKGDINALKAEIIEALAVQSTLIETTVFGVVEAVNANLFLQLTWQTGDITSSIEASILGLKSHIDAKINTIEEGIKKNFDNLKKDLESFLKENIKSIIDECLKNWFKNNKDYIYKELIEQICCNIVGESYIKYDGDNLYMPTLIFRYKNKNKQDPKRYSQIKLRLNLKSDDITDSVVDSLKITVQQLANTTYTAGNLRCLYVSEKRLFKTTVFTQSKQDIINLFKNIIPITKTNFIEQNISYTENSKRNYNLKKQTPLKKTNLNSYTNVNPTTMILNSVYLQINGLDKQLKLL